MSNLLLLWPDLAGKLGQAEEIHDQFYERSFMHTQTQPRKTLIAKSTGIYRGVFLIETPDGGCTFFIGQKQYDFINLAEATSCIDALYAGILFVGAENKSAPTA
jgi:hypothetical protein